MEKSHVTLEQHVCTVCGTRFDTGALLLHKRLKPVFERQTITGWGLCAEHQDLHDRGYVAMVECDPERSTMNAGKNTAKPEEVYRTGRIAHVRREVFAELFSCDISDKQPVVFVELGLIDRIKAFQSPPQD